MTSGEAARQQRALGNAAGNSAGRKMSAATFKMQNGAPLMISVACVFFPDAKLDSVGNMIEGTGSHFFGKHGTPCNCSKLYSHMPCFEEWSQGRAPFGCL
jgi:hypothetical protein